MSTRDCTRGDQSTPVMDTRPETPSSTGSVTTDHAPYAFHPNILRCVICTEPPTDPISTSCGHVFCWPCMHQWLQNGPKPCPVCGYSLQRNLDIIPLYGEGASTNTETSAGTNSTEATRDIDIPPRPRNPFLRTATPTPTPTADNSDSEILTSLGFLLTPSSVYERLNHQLSESLAAERVSVLRLDMDRIELELEAERVRVMHLGIDRIELEMQVCALEEQHAQLRRAARERECVLRMERDEEVQSMLRVRALEEWNGRLAREAEEGRERERRRVERGHEMAELMARLQQSLKVADRQLPQGWSA